MEAASKIWNPLLNYKFGRFAKFIPYSWLKTRIQDKTVELGYVSGGFEVIYAFLEKKIISSNGKIFKKFSIEEISLSKNSKKLLINNIDYDKVVLTTPPSVNKRILKKIGYRSTKIKYLGALCGIIEFNKRPIPSYWLGIADVDKKNKFSYKDFLAVISYAELDRNWN